MPFTGDTFAHLFDWLLEPQRHRPKVFDARLEAEFDGLDTGLSAVAARATALEGASNAPANAEYIVGAASSGLSAERVVTNTSTVTWDTGTAAQAKANAVTQMSVTSDASGLKLSGDEASPGNSEYYGTNSGGTKGFHSLPSALSRVAAESVGTGATYTRAVSSTASLVIVQLYNISHNSGSSQNLRIELSPDGSTWSSAITLTQAAFAAASAITGTVFLGNDGGNNYYITEQISGNTGGAASLSGAMTHYRLSWSGGNFDSGNALTWTL